MMRRGISVGVWGLTLLLLTPRTALAAEGGWQPDPKLLPGLEQKKPTVVYRESEVKPYTLPDPLLCRDGTRVTDRAMWESKGRPETLDLFRTYVYGRSPAKPASVTFTPVATDAAAMEGQATHKRVRITSTDGDKSFSFEASLLLPNQRKGKAAAFLLINNRPTKSADPSRKEKDDFWPAEQIIARGYAAVVFNTNDVDPDKAGVASRAVGVRGVWPAGSGKVEEDAWATIGAWAWGASRVMDWLQAEPDIDSTKVAVIGHSRGGKTALWAGAQDERFAIVISNDSGCAGAALSRRIFGETVAIINRTFPYWFCENFKKFDNKESELPIDQHQLLALIAPRALCVASADGDFWADQRGEFLSLAHAAPVYALYGLPDFKPDEMPPLDQPAARGPVHYHIRKGGHGLTPFDWNAYMDFADGLWKR